MILEVHNGAKPACAQGAASALSLDQVSHAYGENLAVDGVSLELEPGEVVCLLGPSGCGKTTVLRIAAGLEKLQKGTVRLGGKVVAGNGKDLPPEDRGVGLVFQDYALFPHLSVEQNVAFGVRHLSAADLRVRVQHALAQVGMEAHGDSYPHMLSGGQQQRVALARALAPQPRVMLLDEPFSGLDARLRNQIRDDTLHLLKESGAAALLVTHDPEEAMFMADRIALMRDGEIIQLGAPAELYFKPKDHFVANFFGDINRLEAVVQGGSVATPFGRVAVEDLADGCPVDVLIRSEALHLTPASDGNPGHEGQAKVMAARLLGRTSLIHLSTLVDGGEGPHLHARVSGRFLPAENALMDVSLDRSQTFVFKK